MNLKVLRYGTFSVLALSLTALAVAPFFMPDGYSVISHSVSESGSQGVPGGWVARLGMVLLGVSVLMLSRLKRADWGTWATVFHTSFGVSMVLTAFFSHAPWDGSEPNVLEDTLHSITSFMVGMSFIAGVALVAARRAKTGRFRWGDALAAGIAILVSLTMAQTNMGGLLQRLMFLVAYVWYATETLRAPLKPRPGNTRATV